MSSLRIEKINELLREELGMLIPKETSLKEGVFVTIAKVDTAPNLRSTLVSISVFPENETGYAMKALSNKLYHIQGTLNARLRMRPLPRIIFREDATEQQAQNVEELLLAIKQEEKAAKKSKKISRSL